MLRVEIANSLHDVQRGLMFRKHLAEDSGMLFDFNNPQKLNFWGLNTYIPLDIAFVDKTGRIKKISTISPLSSKTVSSDYECVIAIEANLGFFDQNRIRPGDQINIKQLSDKSGIVEFSSKMSK